MQVDFTKITLSDIDGNVAISSDFHKTIANLLYKYANTVDFVEIAIDINKGNPVDLSTKQIEDIRLLIKTPVNRVIPILTYARKAFNEFVDEILAVDAQRIKDEKNKHKAGPQPETALTECKVMYLYGDNIRPD